jgi:carboxyl-terminal processing protease
MKTPRLRVLLSLSTLGLAIALTTAGLCGQRATPPTSVDDRTTEANITRFTTTLLEHSQFAHHPLDRELAGKFLDRFLEALDGGHSLLLQSDVDEFSAYRSTLAKATRESGDTSAAHTIFARYLQRLEERVAYVTKALETAKFDFTGHDTYSFDREHAPWPRDAAAARDLWWRQLRAEYLQEKLGQDKLGPDKPGGKVEPLHGDPHRDAIVKTLRRRQEQQLRTMKGLRSDEVLEVYLNALAHVYDPHSDYLGHEQMESLSIAMNLSLFGIGASLETTDGYCTIRELVPGGPAARSGLLKPGDRIVAVAQQGQEPVDIINMPLSRSVELIRGPKGSTVTLTILPAGAAEGSVPRKTPLVRDEIKLEDQQAKARILDFPIEPAAGQPTGAAVMRIGEVDLPSFYADFGSGAGPMRRSVTADVARLVAKLEAEHVRGIVLDVRRNGGGSLEEAISLTGLFIRKGPVVQTKDPAGEIELGTDSDASILYDGPLVLLTSRFSASASEILAGALQDYGRAVLVGDSSTFGKGTVQNVLPLARAMDQSGLGHAYDPGALKVTIRKFYRPGGASTQLKGVISDIVLPSTSDFAEVSESALTDPLPWDAVPASHFESFNEVQPFLASLRARSKARITHDQDFVLLDQDIARLRKSLTSKSVSLNEADRRAEVAEAKARLAEREHAARMLKVSRPTTYEITLKNAGTPGLPAPMARGQGEPAGGIASATPAPGSGRPGATAGAAGSRAGGAGGRGAGPKDEGGSAAVAGPPRDDLDGLESGGRPTGDDVLLKEAEHILTDYVGMVEHPPQGAMK